MIIFSRCHGRQDTYRQYLGSIHDCTDLQGAVGEESSDRRPPTSRYRKAESGLYHSSMLFPQFQHWMVSVEYNRDINDLLGRDPSHR